MARKNLYLSDRMVIRLKELSEKYGVSESRIVEAAFWLALQGCPNRESLEDWLKRNSPRRIEAQSHQGRKRLEDELLRRIFFDIGDRRVQQRYWRPVW